MHPLLQTSLLLEYGGPALLTAGIFLLDLSVPGDYAAWLLYAIPLALMAMSSRPRAGLYGVGLVALLVIMGAVASPAGILPVSAWINRLLGAALMATVPWLVADRRHHSGSAGATTTPEPAHKESTAAEAVQAIALSEAAPEGAMEDSSGGATGRAVSPRGARAARWRVAGGPGGRATSPKCKLTRQTMSHPMTRQSSPRAELAQG